MHSAHVTGTEGPINIVGPFELHTHTVVAQHSLVPACIDDSESDKILHWVRC